MEEGVGWRSGWDGGVGGMEEWVGWRSGWDGGVGGMEEWVGWRSGWDGGVGVGKRDGGNYSTPLTLREGLLVSIWKMLFCSCCRLCTALVMLEGSTKASFSHSSLTRLTML